MFTLNKTRTALIILIVLNLLDVMTTYYAVNYQGHDEQNPVVAVMIQEGTFLLNKAGYVTLALLLWVGVTDYYSRKPVIEHPKAWKAVTYVIIYPAVAVYLIAVVTNILVVAGLLP